MAEPAHAEHETSPSAASATNEQATEAPETTEADRAAVLRQLDEVREFLASLSMDDVKNGDWFTKLLRASLDQYSQQVTAEWLRTKYPHLPPDAVADARIRLAARYASIEGGLSAAAYTGAVAATIGSMGGASPLTAPAAVTSFVIDLAYTSRLQLRLAHDIAMIYGVPIDVTDSEDTWKLVRVALVIKSGEVGQGVVVKGMPAMIRPLVKKVFSSATLKAAKSLPVIGKHLLQRNIIKFSIPGVTVPVSTLINYWTTRAAGEHAKQRFRTEARIAELVGRALQATPHHDEVLWLVWLVAQVDGVVGDEEVLLLDAATRALAHVDPEAAVLDDLRRVVDVDESAVLGRVAALGGDLTPLYEVAVATAQIDGRTARPERALLDRIAAACRVDVAVIDAGAVAEGGEGRSWTARAQAGGTRVGGLLHRRG